MNPCPCGLSGDTSGRCHCSGEQIQRYNTRISGPLLDRIDIQVEVLRPKTSILTAAKGESECSAFVRKRVIEARRVQSDRAGKANALLDNGEIEQFCRIQGESLSLLEHAVEQLFLSPRACHRILKVSRTIADLDQAADIRTEHLAEAIAFRRLSARLDHV